MDGWPLQAGLYGPLGARSVEEESVQRGVQLRAQRIPARTIARDANTSVTRIYTATRAFGPYSSPLQGAAGTLSLRGVSQMAGLTLPAVTRRLGRGELPLPAGFAARGWPFWRVDDIQRWLELSTQPGCPKCGAPLKRPTRHLARHER